VIWHEMQKKSKSSRVHFTRLMPIYNKITLHYFRKKKRKEKKGKGRVTPKF
jgi:hypothetical protein